MIPSVISVLLLATAHESSGYSLKKYFDLLGNYNKVSDPSESWTGRWFPDKPTPAPSQEPTEVFSENSMSPPREDFDGSWTGRWFPDKPTVLDHPAVITSSSREVSDSWQSVNSVIQKKKPDVDFFSSREVLDDDILSPRKPIPHQKHHDIVISSSGEDSSDDLSWSGRWFPDKPISQENLGMSTTTNREDSSDDLSWSGRWFPDKPISQENLGTSTTTNRPPQDYLVDDWKSELNRMGKTSKHVSEMIAMDNSVCDDGKQNLTLDFPSDESHFVCHSSDRYIQPLFELPPVLTKYPIPPAFEPGHQCMNVSIEYAFSPPSFGNHRPNWAKWGEYDYLPPQRWVHNLEHGGIVMLYNPCAHHFLVNQLKEIVRKCLYKHIITPYRLSSDRPLALVAWGWSLTMSDLDKEEAKKFIEDRANRGPEMIDGDGKYDLYLKHPASEFSKLGQGICSKF